MIFSCLFDTGSNSKGMVTATVASKVQGGQGGGGRQQSGDRHHAEKLHQVGGNRLGERYFLTGSQKLVMATALVARRSTSGRRGTPQGKGLRQGVAALPQGAGEAGCVVEVVGKSYKNCRQSLK